MGSPRHKRFLIAFAFGALVAALTWTIPLTMPIRALIGVNAFFAIYLVLMLDLARTTSAEELRGHAELTDEGVPLILLLALAAVVLSLTAIFVVLNGPGRGEMFERLLALSSVPLGWSALHTLAAFHYAHLYYRREGSTKSGGLVFPDCKAPGPWEFLYFAFTIGMTAQVSDVVANDTPMRQAVLVHSIGSFFYNTVIMALAVNAALTAGA